MSERAEMLMETSDKSVAATRKKIAEPIHLQRLQNLLRLGGYLKYAETFATYSSEEDTSDSDDSTLFVENKNLRKDCKVINGIKTTRSERKTDRARVYNFSKVRKNRKWLKNLLLSDSSSDESDEVTPERFKEMLKCHALKKRYKSQFHTDNACQQYQYYGAGLLSNADKFAEHQKSFSSSKKKSRSKDKKSDKRSKGMKIKKSIKQECKEGFPLDFERTQSGHLDPGNIDDLSPPSSVMLSEDISRGQSPINSAFYTSTPRGHRKEKKPVTEATWNMRRRKIWISIGKKEINRAQKQKISAHKEMMTTCKKLAQACMKEARKEALLSQKAQKEVLSRCKRMSREMLLYWKKFDKVEKEHRKRAEKEAQEQLKMDIELQEAKRQQRKLNFLITQTELYAHFMSRKITGQKESHKDEILSQLDEPENNNKYSSFKDDYDSELVKAEVQKNVVDAYTKHVQKTHMFEVSKSERASPENQLNDDLRLANPNLNAEEEKPQPKMFVGKLKSYQLKGMNWLYQLYNNGINGILADEMGLGKTVQSIAFLAHVAETQGIWGPFLVIAPASTLHNWQQEFSRFVPKFKVLPYWGNGLDRKTIRKFWNEKDLHTEQASFHILITSYQLVIQDVKYFQRIKWQYMVLDEAQAIKSASSARWKVLLGFNCRNRLLLTGTPIQNSMAELWALLHYIMPTMFDSHQEFNEWFSKDIESYAENKSIMDEKHLSRLHMILKPFMLRRIKKDVENELSDKIEILMCCSLTSRQKNLYQLVKNNISIEDLCYSSSSSISSSQAQSFTSNLMNLVIQFRKVCNHPELFERREVKSPFFMQISDHHMTKFIYRNALLKHTQASHQRVVHHTLGIFHPLHIYSSLSDKSCDSLFSFLPFFNMAPSDISNIMLSGLLLRWLALFLNLKAAYRIHHQVIWKEPNEESSRFRLILSPRSVTHPANVHFSQVLKHLIFTSFTQAVYTHLAYSVHHMPETKQHYQMRMKKCQLLGSTTQASNMLSSPKEKKLFPLKNGPIQILACCPTEVPKFLLQTTPKAIAKPIELMCSDCDAALKTALHQSCGSYDGLISVLYGNKEIFKNWSSQNRSFTSTHVGGLVGAAPSRGWSRLVPLDKEMLVTDSGKLKVLDWLLTTLKEQGHRVLIYSQMTKMIDLLEEYMWHRKHTYMRLDGSSKISDRRDMVADFQSRSDIFVFLLSTRAGGLGINLTAADTVIFYDSDWNPTVDQQAMDRAHRLGQTKQVTVYRLICKGTIEERILQRAREKSEIQRMVISGGNFKPDTLKPKEVVSLLLDDDEMQTKLLQKQEERRAEENGDKKRKRKDGGPPKGRKKEKKNVEENVRPITPVPTFEEIDVGIPDSVPPSPYSEQRSPGSILLNQDETSNEEGSLVVDDNPTLLNQGLMNSSPSSSSSFSGSTSSVKLKGRGTGRRGRPKGSGKKGPGAASGGVGPNSVGGIGRGRGAGAMSAAEIAGAQAGRSAAFAAYGYQLNTAGGQTSTVSSSPSASPTTRGGTRGSFLRNRRGGITRGSSQKKILFNRFHSKDETKSNKDASESPTPVAPSMGFYTQND